MHCFLLLGVRSAAIIEIRSLSRPLFLDYSREGGVKLLCDSQREQKHLITCSVIIENKVWERDREGETEGERHTEMFGVTKQ